MAGAMRKMGVYLGLVEDDDTRGGYDRYASRQGDYERDERGYDRGGYDRYAADHDDAYGEPEPAVAESRYGAGQFGEAGYGASGYGAPGYDTEHAADRYAGDRFDDRGPERVPEPEVSLGRRSPAPRTLGLAPAPAPTLGSTSARLVGGAGIGAGGSGSPARSRMSGGVSGSAGLAMSEPLTVQAAPEPAPAPTPAPKTPNYRITTVHPKDYNEARTIGERFRDGMPVIMNLTEMEHADAKRLVDFAIGLTFGLHGSIERVTAKVFLLSPQDVDVTAEDKARIREGGFFQQP
ncbi:cell division protein SepF [Modestobacter muralis]|uniref:cell division protein SepF n=1 Tax=Modestobacter muralis TaxID=1608614 RepID=UPI001478EF72|nr:cell division protein SepF [Modestobacter muralis]